MAQNTTIQALTSVANNNLNLNTPIPVQLPNTDIFNKVSIGQVKASIYATCDTASNVAAKVAKLSNFPDCPINQGLTITVIFENANTAENITLKLQNSSGTDITGAIQVMALNSALLQLGAGSIKAGARVVMEYDGTYWQAHTDVVSINGNILTKASGETVIIGKSVSDTLSDSSDIIPSGKAVNSALAEYTKVENVFSLKTYAYNKLYQYIIDNWSNLSVGRSLYLLSSTSSGTGNLTNCEVIKQSANFGTVFVNSFYGNKVMTLYNGDWEVSDVTTSSEFPNLENKSLAVQNGYISPTGSIVESEGYAYSDIFKLSRGVTVQFSAAGSAGACILSEWDSSGNFKTSLIVGDLKFHRFEYTAEKDIYLRICTRCTVNGTNGFVPMDYFKKIKTYNKNKLLKNEKLNGKKIVVIGDSLIYGNTFGNEITWLRKLELLGGAICYNYGINGNPLSYTSDCMAVRYANISEIESADIIIVEGGANDKNQNVPIGENSDSDITTFKGGCNVLIDGLRAKNPKAVILFMTTYHRYNYGNALNLNEVDYANAMIEVCKMKAIPCFNNCEFSGISFLDSSLKTWCDEGIYMGSFSNQHFSPLGYDYITPKYKNFIESNL